MIAPAFHESALCAEVDGDLWFPEKGGSTRLAKLICNGDDTRPPCPAREECLVWALLHGESGVWGGTSEQERRRLRRRTA